MLYACPPPPQHVPEGWLCHCLSDDTPGRQHAKAQGLEKQLFTRAGHRMKRQKAHLQLPQMDMEVRGQKLARARCEGCGFISCAPVLGKDVRDNVDWAEGMREEKDSGPFPLRSASGSPKLEGKGSERQPSVAACCSPEAQGARGPSQCVQDSGLYLLPPSKQWHGCYSRALNLSLIILCF